MSSDEFKLLSAWGKKLLCSLMVKQRILVYLLPDGSSVNRLWLGWVFSFFWALCCHLTSPMSLILCGWVPLMLWEVLITHCRAFLSGATHEPCQTAMFPFRMLSLAPLSNLISLSLELSRLKFSQKVEPFLCYFNRGDDV